MNSRDERGQIKGPGRGRGIDMKQKRPRDGKLFRRRTEPMPDHGTHETHAALWLPLLDIEVVSLDLHRSWHTLFPDADER